MKQTDFYYFAKQPILDGNLSTYGYELLFRSAEKDTEAIFDDPDFATVNVISYGFVKSQEEIKQSKRIFINFTEQLLLAGAPRSLPPAVTVIEVLESIGASEQVVQELIRYKQEGYMIAIDDYTGDQQSSQYLDFADIIKIDVFGKNEQEVARILATLEGNNALKLAEKVDNGKAFRDLQQFNFDLYQGYFFARPENLGGKTVKSSQLAKIKILAALQQQGLETAQIVSLIAVDPSLAYRLLKLLNSAAFGFSVKIESIQHAVVLLGMQRVRYWLQVIILADINNAEHPQELLHTALNRGKILEELARDGAISLLSAESIFLFGLLSLLDIMLGTPFEAISKELPLAKELVSGYLDPGSDLAGLLELLNKLESDDSETIITTCEKLNLQPGVVLQACVRAHAWTEAIFQDAFRKE